MIADDKIRWFLARCTFIGGTAELKKDTSCECVRPIVADNTEEEHGWIESAIVQWLRSEEVMH
jgi:hypothetical protein